MIVISRVRDQLGDAHARLAIEEGNLEQRAMYMRRCNNSSIDQTLMGRGKVLEAVKKFDVSS